MKYFRRKLVHYATLQLDKKEIECEKTQNVILYYY